MSWFTPERRLYIYNVGATVVSIAITFNFISASVGNEALSVFTQVLDAVAAVFALGGSLIARKHVTLPKK